MNKDQPTTGNSTSDTTETKPGFFTRIFTKMDNAMKTKADEAAKSECCAPNDKGTGGKCC
ncbi:MAG: hypothetical protein ACN4GF_10530 [Lentimonas sp.]